MLTEMIGEISMGFYRDWYHKDVKPNLTREEKEEVLKQISEISLRVPIYEHGINMDHKEVPKLAKFSHTENFTGWQLYVVMTEIFNELQGEAK